MVVEVILPSLPWKPRKTFSIPCIPQIININPYHTAFKNQKPGADPGFRRGEGSYIQKWGGGGGGSYRNFRSGSKLLQVPGQINKQKKLQTDVGGGGPITQKNPCIRA